MEGRFHHELEDSLFKNNVKQKLYKLKVIGYDTIDESYFMNQMIPDIDDCIDSKKSMISDCEDMVQPFPWDKPDTEEISEIKKYRREIRSLEKMKKYIEDKKYKVSPKKYYLYKEFRKATYIDQKGKSNNYLDTLKIVFKQDLQLLKNEKDYPPEYIRLYNELLSN
jgi:hypothetical protein